LRVGSAGFLTTGIFPDGVVSDSVIRAETSYGMQWRDVITKSSNAKSDNMSAFTIYLPE
jgi:hypothetical protein